MHRTLFLLVAAILATCTLAAPIPPPMALVKRSFSVPIQGRPKLSPAAAMAQFRRKYGLEGLTSSPVESFDDTVRPSFPVAASSGGHALTSKPASTQPNSAESGEVTASPEKADSEYLAPVTIGGQKLTLDLDTGSSDLWVFSTRLPPTEDSGHTLFNPDKSSTWTNLPGAEWTTSYGDGSGASGSVGYDTVNIGGAVVRKQCVEVADQVSSQFIDDTKSDGIVGLAFSTLNQVRPQPQKTFFENIMDDLEQPLFTVNLEDGSGTYDFGTIDASQYSGEIHYASVNNGQGYWEFETPTFSVGGNVHQCTSTGCSATIADTGTSLMLLDQDVVQAYYSQVEGSESTQDGWIFPCTSKLPDFGITIGNSGYTAIVLGSDLTYLDLGSNQCFGGIQWNNGINLAILGDVLLKDHFAVFDGGNLAFGIAVKA